MNAVMLIGRLARDPEMKFIPSGKALCRFTVAVDRGFGENKETDWLPVTAWEKQAEFVANYLTKGSRVAVEGRLQSRTYETQEGQKRTVYEVVAHRVESMDPPKKDAGSGHAARSRAAAEVQSAGAPEDEHDPFSE